MLQARALYQLGRSDAALAALNLPLDQVPENLRADTLFWQAESLLDLGKWPEAEQKYRALLALKDQRRSADQAANLGLAWALFNQGKEADAQPHHPGADQGQGRKPRRPAGAIAPGQNRAGEEAIQGSHRRPRGASRHADPKRAWPSRPTIGSAKPTPPTASPTRRRRPTSGSPAIRRLSRNRSSPAPGSASGRAQQALQQNDQAMLAYEQTYKLTENEATQLDCLPRLPRIARGPAANCRKPSPSSRNSPRPPIISAPGALFAIGVGPGRGP